MSRQGFLGTARAALIAGLACAGPVRAEPWLPLQGAGLRDMLAGARIVFQAEQAVQAFEPSGRTVWDAGRQSEGRWRADPVGLCLLWDGDADWTCHRAEVAPDGARMCLTAPDGSAAEGRLIR